MKPQFGIWDFDSCGSSVSAFWWLVRISYSFKVFFEEQVVIPSPYWWCQYILGFFFTVLLMFLLSNVFLGWSVWFLIVSKTVVLLVSLMLVQSLQLFLSFRMHSGLHVDLSFLITNAVVTGDTQGSNEVSNESFKQLIHCSIKRTEHIYGQPETLVFSNVFDP